MSPHSSHAEAQRNPKFVGLPAGIPSQIAQAKGKVFNLGWSAQTDENRGLCQKWGHRTQNMKYRKSARLLNGNGMLISLWLPSWCSAVSLRRSTTPDCSGFVDPIPNVSCLDENLWDAAGRYPGAAQA